jgi:drug/metabolite transporter (DMT)-like permease
MNPALWGGLSALSLGTADFAARFSSRAIGHANALLGVLIVGAAVLTAWALLSGAPLIWDSSGYWLLALNGIATTVMTLLLYLGLARGPVSIVAPIVASHPVLVVLFWVALGAAPSPLQWLAMAVTVVGVVIVARSTKHYQERGLMSASYLRTSVLIAFAAALVYTAALLAGQLAVPIYGQFQTLWLGRLVSLAALLIYFFARRERPGLPRRWWPFLTAQGLLDAGGYLFLLMGSGGPGAEIAVVAASGFAAVTVVLARLVLREAMSGMQWLGVVLIFAGVAALSAHP